MILRDFKDGLRVRYEGSNGMLHFDNDGYWYVLHNDDTLDGARPANEWRHKGYEYSWGLGNDPDRDLPTMRPRYIERWGSSKLEFKFITDE